jgi:hypothetical protein
MEIVVKALFLPRAAPDQFEFHGLWQGISGAPMMRAPDQIDPVVYRWIVMQMAEQWVNMCLASRGIRRVDGPVAEPATIEMHTKDDEPTNLPNWVG